MRYAEEIIFCFDGDSAGQNAAWRAMMNSISAITDNVRLKFLFLPKNHDPDSFIRENSKEAFDEIVAEALPLTEYVIKKLTSNNDLSSQDKKVKLLNEVEPILEQMKAPKLNLLFRKRVAQLVGLDIEEIKYSKKIRSGKRYRNF